MFKAIKSKTCVQNIQEQIIELVENGLIQPSTRLPSEKELSVQFNVGRSTVREALSRLSQMGLLEVRRGINGGTYVKEITAKPLTEILSLFFKINHIPMIQLLEARRIVEINTVTLAAERSNKEDLNNIKTAMKNMENRLFDPQEFPRLNTNFHLAIARASGNEILAFILDCLVENLIYFQSKFDLTLQIRKEVIIYHRNIYYAICDKNRISAEQAMLKHLVSFERHLLKRSDMDEDD